jgi:hypothetical protein
MIQQLPAFYPSGFTAQQTAGDPLCQTPAKREWPVARLKTCRNQLPLERCGSSTKELDEFQPGSCD